MAVKIGGEIILKFTAQCQKGAQDYLKIMSLISTGNKHDINAFDALTVAFSSNAEIILRESSE